MTRLWNDHALRGIHVWIEPMFNSVAGRREYSVRGIDEAGKDVFNDPASYFSRDAARKAGARRVQGKGYVKGFIDR